MRSGAVRYLAAWYSPSTSQLLVSAVVEVQANVPLPVAPLSLPVPPATVKVPLEWDSLPSLLVSPAPW